MPTNRLDPQRLVPLPINLKLEDPSRVTQFIERSSGMDARSGPHPPFHPSAFGCNTPQPHVSSLGQRLAELGKHARHKGKASDPAPTPQLCVI